MTNTKYRRILEDYKEIGDKILYRIEALKDFNGVKAGSLGGYIESEDNLSRDGDAWVCSNARIGGNAMIRDNASWLIVGPIGSRDDFTTFFSGEDGIYVSCGCFYGSISEFEKAVEKTHAGTKHEKDYKLAIALAKSRIATAEVDKDEI